MSGPAPNPEPNQRETWSVERHKASALPSILRLAGMMRLTGSVTVNLSQGKPINLEIKTKLPNGNGNGHTSS